MKKIVLLLLLTLFAVDVAVATDDVSLPAVGGYDLVSYFTENQAVKGSGFHPVVYDDQTYLFSSKENKEKFEKTPAAYLPQFGGWCAYGVSLGKKFHVDPTVFEIVDGKLYFNLDGDIQKKWSGDKEANLKTAHSKWDSIKSVSAGEL